jgi:hypothetical protein
LPPIIPTTEPKVLIAGDTWQWYRNRSDYTQFPNSEGWTARYDITGPTIIALTGAYQSATQQDLFTASAATTAAYVAGDHNWVLRFVGSGTYAGQLFAVASGPLLILPNYATSSAAVSHAEKVLASIEAAIEARTSGDIESYSIAGRAFTKIPMERLLAMRGIYRHLVFQERNPGASGPKWQIEFNAAR